MNAETTASHITAVMKIATTQAGPRRRYVMQMANQKKPSLTWIFHLSTERSDSRRGGVFAAAPRLGIYNG
jgi:hypothetical protein